MDKDYMWKYHKTLHQLAAVKERYAKLEAENKHVYSNIESALAAMSKEKYTTAERLLQDLIDDRY